MKVSAMFALLGLSIVLSSSLPAQTSVTVETDQVTMSKGKHNAYLLTIPQADYESSLKNWKKEIRKNTKNKVEESDHEIYIEATLIELIYNTPINIYSSLIRSDSNIKLYAVFEIDSVMFDFENSEKSIREEKINSQIRHFLYNFGTTQYLFAVENELAEEENKLKDLNKELGNLEKEQQNALEAIAENEQNIRNSEDAIAVYTTDNERKISEINSKKESIANLSDDKELRDQANDQLKALEKEKRGIESNLEKEQKNIVRYKSTIEAMNKEVEELVAQQGLKKEQIDSQQKRVEAVRTKLGQIR